MSRAGEVISKTQTSVVELLAQERFRWSEHVARMGTEGKPQHLLKAVLQFRPISWWRQQQILNNIGKDPITHRAKMGHVRKWESHLSLNWIINATQKLVSLLVPQLCSFHCN